MIEYMEKPIPSQHWFVRLCAGFGNVSVLVQWLFVGMMYLSVASRYDWLRGMISSPSESPVLTPRPIPETTTGFGFFELLTVVIVVVVIGAVMVYAARHLPSTIVSGGDKLTQKSAEILMLALLNHDHKHTTKKRRLQLTVQLVIAIKGLLVLLPLLLLMPLYLFDYQPLEPHVLWTAAAFGASTSVLWFTLEQLLTRSLDVRSRKAD